jgi:DNA primase
MMGGRVKQAEGSRLAGSDPALDEFKARLPLAEIVGRYVKLTRRGREHVGLCPFHREKTPSFNVVDEKGFYHCFGCGAHGNAIDFVMQVENLSFGDALARLGEMTGLPPPRRTAQSQAQAEAGERLRAANAAASVWFQAQLAGAAGREAMAYLERRGLDRATIRGFELGYAPPDGQSLRRALNDQGFSDRELQGAGLTKADEGGEPFGHFRHRLMFPIADERGRTVGFGGRALGEARAKYLNTPETEIFHKGDLLYNLHRAKGAARTQGTVILAEGYMDVIALTQAGLAHAVAPLGTAVTERQLASLWRIAEAPVLCLDGDRAGLAAAMRAAERALPAMRAGQTLRFALLPDGEDPDSYLRRHGAAALASVLSKAHTLSQMIWRLETQGRRFDTPEARAALSRRLRGLARLAGDPDLRTGLLDQFKALLADQAPRPARRDRTPERRASNWDGVGPSRLAAGITRRENEREAAILLPLLRWPEWLEGHEEELGQLQFRDAGYERMRQEIVAWYSEAASLDADALARHLHQYGLGRVLDQLAGHLTQQPATDPPADAQARQNWCEMLAAMRHRSALEQERSTVDGVTAGDGGHLNRWFGRLDRLLNRDGAGEADQDEG